MERPVQGSVPPTLKCYTEEEYEAARIEKSVKKVLDAL